MCFNVITSTNQQFEKQKKTKKQKLKNKKKKKFFLAFINPKVTQGTRKTF